MDTFSILRASDRRDTPWKNGGGLTSEVIVSPAGADFESFDWRISIATVHADGPFSQLPGIDRELVLLEGRLALQVGEQPALELSPTSAPLAMGGEEATYAQLLGGPVTDLNVMTRRGRRRSTLGRRILRAGLTLHTLEVITVLIPMESLRIEHEGVEQIVQPRDAVMLRGKSALQITPNDTNTTLYLIEITTNR